MLHTRNSRTEKINEVRSAMEHNLYIVALALALTFPDICSQVETGRKKGSESIYKKWFNTYIDYNAFNFPVDGFKNQTFDGEMCYLLRCKILHEGNTELKSKKINSFNLILPKKKNDNFGYQYVKTNNKEYKTNIKIDYLCDELCKATEKFYNSWNNKADFDKYNINWL